MKFKAFTILVFFFPMMSSAHGGSDVGNGGDSYALEFVSVGKSLLQHWDELQLSSSLHVTKSEFTRALMKAHVYSSSEPLLIGKAEVDAKNFPFCDQAFINPSTRCGEILINRRRWDAIAGDSFRKMALVLHEYLGVLGMKERFDDFYQLSAGALGPIRSLLEKQSHVKVNFSCSISGWDAKNAHAYVIDTIDTYDTPEPKLGFKVNSSRDDANDFWLELIILPGDILAPTSVDQAFYRLSRGSSTPFPSPGELLTSGAIEFHEVGRRSLRIYSSPDLQLTCYRTYDESDNRRLNSLIQ